MSRTLFDRLVRAREALARAKADPSTDPWRLAELQQRHDELAEAAASAPAPELALHYETAARRPAEPLSPPPEWVDDSGRRRPRRGEA